MKPCLGIIAEYNPFHNGHRHQLERARALFPGARVAIAMSGSFTQRGEPACADKFTRARWALLCGADIVFELPTSFALASAERFARGGVGVLGATGLVDALCFGAEDADSALLCRLARMTGSESGALGERLKAHLSHGKCFPAARAAAVMDAHGAGDEKNLKRALLSPNNILALEYIKAIDAFHPGMRPLPIARLGAGHDAPAARDGFASASALRAALARGEAAFLRPFVPEAVYCDALRLAGQGHMPSTADALSDAFVYALRRLSPAQLERLPDVAEGLHNALYREARRCTGYAEVLEAVKSKRYTAARLRRILACALLGLTKEQQRAFPTPPYLRVLGVRKDAANLLSELSRTATLPVVTCKADYDALEPGARELLALDLFAGEVLAMASPSPVPAPYEFARALMMV